MGETCTIQAKDYKIQASQLPSDITDIYICVFFDGTGNNMYEQEHKQKKMVEHLKTAANRIRIGFAISPNLFASVKQEQKEQAKRDYNIDKDRNTGNGGRKYSNVAVLRSIAKNKEITKTIDSKGNNIIGVAYNLYIEGSGQLWDIGNDKEGLGMGTGRTGVVGLVSKAVIFVTDYVNSLVSFEQRPNVNLHFAVFGFLADRLVVGSFPL